MAYESFSPNHIVFPCRACNKNVHVNDHAIQCDLCNFWIHIQCNNLNYVDYIYLQVSIDPWYCITCSSLLFPFNCLNNNAFSFFSIKNNYSSQPMNSCTEKNTSLF